MEGPVVADRFYCVLKYHEDGTVEFLYQCISYDAALKHQWEQNSKLFESDRHSYKAKAFSSYESMKHFVDKLNEIAFMGKEPNMLVDVTHPDNKSILDEIVKEQDQEIAEALLHDAKKMFIVEEIKENIVVTVEREVVYAQMFFTAEAALEWKKARELENDEQNVYYNMFVDDMAQSVQVDC